MWHALPRDVQLNVLARLGASSEGPRMRLVCRTWAAMVPLASGRAWVSGAADCREVLRRLCGFGGGGVAAHFHGRVTDVELGSTATSTWRARELTDHLRAALASPLCAEMRRLAVGQLKWDADAVIEAVVDRCPRLEALVLGSPRFGQYWVDGPATLWRGFEHVQELQCWGDERTGAQRTLVVAARLPRLRRITLRRVKTLVLASDSVARDVCITVDQTRDDGESYCELGNPAVVLRRGGQWRSRLVVDKRASFTVGDVHDWAEAGGMHEVDDLELCYHLGVPHEMVFDRNFV